MMMMMMMLLNVFCVLLFAQRDARSFLNQRAQQHTNTAPIAMSTCYRDVIGIGNWDRWMEAEMLSDKVNTLVDVFGDTFASQVFCGRGTDTLTFCVFALRLLLLMLTMIVYGFCVTKTARANDLMA